MLIESLHNQTKQAIQQIQEMTQHELKILEKKFEVIKKAKNGVTILAILILVSFYLIVFALDFFEFVVKIVRSKLNSQKKIKKLNDKMFFELKENSQLSLIERDYEEKVREFDKKFLKLLYKKYPKLTK